MEAPSSSLMCLVGVGALFALVAAAFVTSTSESQFAVRNSGDTLAGENGIELSKYVRVMTFNVWFAPNAFDERMMAIVNLILENDVDVVCLQEVTKESEIIFKKELAEDYDVNDHPIRGYGVLVFVKKHFEAEFGQVLLPSGMGRSLVWLQGKDLPVLATVHLESLDSHPTRCRQLTIIEQFLRDSQDAILCGDFNFDSRKNFNEGRAQLENDSLIKIMPEYTDAWPSLYADDDSGITFDTAVNTWLAGKRPEQMRYDRVMAKLKSGKWSLADIKIVGNQPIETKYLGPRFPSDHWGLVSTFFKEP